MAFNWQTFKTRTITSIVFAAVMLIGLLWNRWSFFILFSIIHFGCWWEYLKLGEKIYQTKLHLNFKLGLMMFSYFFIVWFGWLNYSVYFRLVELIFSIIPMVGLFLLVIGRSQTQNLKSNMIGFIIVGVSYLSLSLGLMQNLRFDAAFHYKNHFIPCDLCPPPKFFEFHWSIPIIIIFSLWVNDTMAYLIGSLIGKTPLSKISPKKTWEGTIGGILLTIGIALFVAWLADLKMINIAIIATIAAIVGTFGDLLESKLKRMAGVKDSGSFMPGFGGFLDRFDSMLLAIPAVWLFVYFFMK